MGILRSELPEAIRRAIIDGIRRNGERIFDISQQTESCFVPVDKGTLKRSGYVKPLPNGVEIAYVSPYASRVEFGGPAIPFKGTQTVHVRAHRRRDGTDVQAHERHYTDKRLVGFRPKYSKFERGPLIFRVLKEEPAREGQFFLTRAVQKGLPSLRDDLDFALQKLKER